MHQVVIFYIFLSSLSTDHNYTCSLYLKLAHGKGDHKQSLLFLYSFYTVHIISSFTSKQK